MIVITILFVIIQRQPKVKCDLGFKAPMVPFLPTISLFLNIYLMFQLNISTWIRFGIWFIFGMIVYFTYGVGTALIRNRQNQSRDHQLPDLSPVNNSAINKQAIDTPPIHIGTIDSPDINVGTIKDMRIAQSSTAQQQ